MAIKTKSSQEDISSKEKTLSLSQPKIICMDKGGKICDVLKAVRKKIAEMNGITYEPKVCHYHGHCSGTCPACEAERKYIEDELSLREQMGKAVCVTGVALGILAAPYNAYAQETSSATPVNNEVIAADSVSESEQVTIRGCVKEADGTPMIGAFVVAGDKRPYNMTDIDGNFSVTIHRDSTLQLEYLGYKDKIYSFDDLDLNGFNTLCMTEVTPSMGEVVVIEKPNKKRAKKLKKKVLESDVDMKIKKPSFPGGNNAMLQFIAKNLRMPETLYGAYQQRIIVSFCVLGDGSLADVKVVTECPPEMKQEVLRLVKSMPKWKAAMKDGKPTYEKMKIPIYVRPQ